MAPAAVPSVRLGVPAYFYPWPGDASWAALADAPPGTLVVLTPDNGPGRAADGNYGTALGPLRARGAHLYGYVDSGYATRDAATLLTEVEAHVAWYGIDGVFVDQVLATAEHRAAYAGLSVALRGRGLRVALNPGQPVIDRSYLELADHLLVFEGTLATYRLQDFPRWTTDVARDQLWHCVYEVDDAQGYAEMLRIADRNNAGVVFATDGRMPNPWDRLPPYWDIMVTRAVQAAPDG